MPIFYDSSHGGDEASRRCRRLLASCGTKLYEPNNCSLGSELMLDAFYIRLLPSRMLYVQHCPLELTILYQSYLGASRVHHRDKVQQLLTTLRQHMVLDDLSEIADAHSSGPDGLTNA